jgi:hypothetical protein
MEIKRFLGHIESQMAPCRLGFTVDQYGWITEQSNHWWKTVVLIFSCICETVYGRHKKSLMILRKPGFVKSRYCWKLELFRHFWCESPASNFNNMCWAVCGIHGGVHEWPYLNQALIKITVAQTRNYPTTLNDDLPYQIWRQCPQRYELYNVTDTRTSLTST